MSNVWRRIRGAIGNAMVWAGAWFVASFGFWTAMHLFTGFLPVSNPWALILLLSASSSVSGFVTGLAFSGYLRFAYWERALLEIRTGRVALGGALTAGVVTVALSLASQSMSGLYLGMTSLLIGTAWPTVLGGLTAAGSIRVAQHSARQVASAATDQLEVEQEEVMALLEE